MSGIGGILALDGEPQKPGAAARLSAAVAHRGPDASGVWSDDSIALVHSLLITTIESAHERQPVADTTAGLAVVADLRLDNREELIHLLDIDRERAKATGDAALVLAAYRRWGRQCPEHLDGDFAFALWDSRERQLFCARDPFGVKPFVYCFVPGKLLAFASEIRAVLSIDGVPRQLDEQRIADFLSIHFADAERTFYGALRRLPGGCTLLFRNGAIEVARYWSAERVRPLRLSCDAEYAQGYREHFGRAVRARMRVTHAAQLGSMLSGGLDSSAIACFARDELSAAAGDPLPVFSWIFSDAMDADEREYQAIVAQQGGMERHVLDSATAGYSPWSDLEQFLPDGPLYAPNFYLNYGAAKLARGLGVRTLLDGAGGDSTISRGDTRLIELLWRGRPFALIRELSALARHRDGQQSASSLFINKVIAPFAPGSVRRFARWFRGGAASKCGLKLLLPRIARMSGAANPPYRPSFTAYQQHLSELTSPMLAEGLELFDRVMAHAGVEARYPFFDRRLAEYCLSLPADQKLANGYSRIVARRAMQGSVPPAVQWRGGKGKPGLHVIPVLRAHRSRLDDIFLRDPAVLAPYIDIDVLRLTYADFLEQRPMQFATVVRLWSVAVLGCWLRQHQNAR